MADYNTIRVDQTGSVVTLTLNKPDKMNAMGPEMVGEMLKAFDTLPGMGARALLITGEGRGFSSGADLSARQFDGGKPGDASRRSLQTSFNPLMLALAGLDIPVVTAVNGAAAGIGCTLALSGDLIVAAKSSYFLQAFVNIGLVPDGGSTWLLQRGMGAKRALQAILEGRKIPAEDALDYGLVNATHPMEALATETTALAERLSTGAPLAAAAAKRLIRSMDGMSYHDAIAAEASEQTALSKSQDSQEGIAAFLQKRKPAFKGE